MIIVVSIVVSIFWGEMTRIGIFGKTYLLSATDVLVFFLFMPVVTILISRRNKIILDYNMLIYIVLLTYILFSAFWTVDPYKVIRGFITFSFSFLIYFLVFNLYINNELISLTKVINVLTVIGFILAIIVVKIFLNNYDLISSDINTLKRAYKIGLGKSNYIASFLMFLSFVSLLSINYLNKSKTLKTLHLSLLFLSIILLASKGAILTTAFVFIIFCRKNKKWLLMYALVLITVLILKPFNLDLLNELSQLNDPVRIWLIQIGWESFKSNPLFGIGINNYSYLIGDHYNLTNAHNSVFQLLVEMGIIGSLLYLALYLRLYKFYKKTLIINNELVRIQVKALIIAVISMMVHSNLEVIIFTPSYEYLIALLFAVISAQYYRSVKTHETTEFNVHNCKL